VHVPLESETVKVTVVGDLHGQLSDLVYLLNKCGMPSATHKYIFNGDFVDRGLKVHFSLIFLHFRVSFQ
jgi:Calcineurin-like phosphoesterase